MISEVGRFERPAKYQFGDFELLPQKATLLKSGIRVRLKPKVLAILSALVEHAGATVSKEQLMSTVWGGLAVEENNLTQCISTLRKVLGEKRGENRFIATESGMGYRFVAPVNISIDPDVPPLVPSNGLNNIGILPPADLATHPSARATNRWRQVATLLAVSAVCISLVAAGFLLKQRHAPAGVRHRAVAVLNVRNLSKNGAESWLETALPEMLASELGSDANLLATPPEDVARWRADVGPAQLAAAHTELIRLARRNIAAGIFVLGSYVAAGTCPDCRIRVDLRVYDSSTAENLGTIVDEAASGELLDLAERLGIKLRSQLGAPASSPQPSWPSASAMRHYAEGLNALRHLDPIAAREHLQVALAADPGNALVHAALADTWTMLGFGVRAKDESLTAYQLSKPLSRLEQLGIEARYRASVQQWDRAIAVYQKIFDILPDSLEDGLNFARAQYRGSKLPEARVTLEKLRRLPKPAGDDPRIDMLEAQIAGISRDFVKTRDFAHRAADQAKLSGARYAYARARLLEGGAKETLREADAFAVQTEARQVCEAIGDRQCVSQAWRVRGNDRFARNRFEEAEQAYNNGVAVARELGDRAELANLFNGLGVVAESKQDWSSAEKYFKQAIDFKKETAYNPSEVQIELANLYQRLGRRQAAAQVIEEALGEAQKVNAHEDLGELLFLRSTLERGEGRLHAAQKSGEQAVAELQLSNSASLSLAQSALSSILTARGDLQTAETILSGAKPTPAGGGAGDIELAQAELLLAKSQFQQAGEEAKRSAEDFFRSHETGNAVLALLVEANALDVSGKHGDAKQIVQEALRTPGLADEPLAFSRARLLAWRLDDQSSFLVPDSLHADLERLQDMELSLEEALDRAIRAKRGGVPQARQLLEAVANRAANEGYLTMSRHARLLE